MNIIFKWPRAKPKFRTTSLSRNRCSVGQLGRSPRGRTWRLSSLLTALLKKDLCSIKPQHPPVTNRKGTRLFQRLFTVDCGSEVLYSRFVTFCFYHRLPVEASSALPYPVASFLYQRNRRGQAVPGIGKGCHCGCCSCSG